MQTYVSEATAIIATSIEENNGNIGHLEVGDDLADNYLFQVFQESLRFPVFDFSVRDADERALAIAIHQFHGHQISLNNYVLDGNEFSGTLSFRSYDHFGLDVDDEITEYGFVDWFTLQHFDRFNGRYTPSLAVVEVEVPISGSF